MLSLTLFKFNYTKFGYTLKILSKFGSIMVTMLLVFFKKIFFAVALIDFVIENQTVVDKLLCSKSNFFTKIETGSI